MSFAKLITNDLSNKLNISIYNLNYDREGNLYLKSVVASDEIYLANCTWHLEFMKLIIVKQRLKDQ